MTLGFDRWTVLGQSYRNRDWRAWKYAPGVTQRALFAQVESGVLILMQRHYPDGTTELVGALRKPPKGRR